VDSRSNVLLSRFFCLANVSDQPTGIVETTAYSFDLGNFNSTSLRYFSPRTKRFHRLSA
jgi:hypothetical protein